MNGSKWVIVKQNGNNRLARFLFSRVEETILEVIILQPFRIGRVAIDKNGTSKTVSFLQVYSEAFSVITTVRNLFPETPVQ